jgi:hypothetical protein
VLSGIGHGNSFPSLSNATGRLAIVGSSTVERTGKGCCPATNGTIKDAAMNIPASLVGFFMLGTHIIRSRLFGLVKNITRKRRPMQVPILMIGSLSRTYADPVSP